MPHSVQMRRSWTRRIDSRIACAFGTAWVAHCRFEDRRATRPSGLDKRFRPEKSMADEIVSVKLMTPRAYVIRRANASKKPPKGSLSHFARERVAHGRVRFSKLRAASRAARMTRTRPRDSRIPSQSESRSHWAAWPLLPESCDHASKATRGLTPLSSRMRILVANDWQAALEVPWAVALHASCTCRRGLINFHT